MPTGDRTGPMGQGPRTGRGAGYCAGYENPGFANPAFAHGFRAGMGAERRFRRWNRFQMQAGWMGYGYQPGAYPPPTPITAEQEQEALKAQESWLQEQLDAVRGRMKKEE